jgi:hypothetical protein
MLVECVTRWEIVIFPKKVTLLIRGDQLGIFVPNIAVAVLLIPGHSQVKSVVYSRSKYNVRENLHAIGRSDETQIRAAPETK